MEEIILIVDDDLFYGQLITYILSQRTSYRTQLVRTGSQALLIARATNTILFLLDYRLPDMNGLALYDQLHALEGRPQVPAILLSADLPNEEIEVQLAARAIIGISKPGDIARLSLTIDQLVVK